MSTPTGETVPIENKRGRLKALWADPVWSKVISSGIIAVIGVIVGGLAYHYRTTPAAIPQTPAVTHESSIIETRNALINGSTWYGTTSSIKVPGEEPGIPPFPITFHFVVRDNQVTGGTTFEHDGRWFETKFKGEFYNESYIKLEYWHINGVNAFGYMILKLDHLATTMSGKCVVYGSITQRISVEAIRKVAC
jgi:hypothetical protein